MTQFKRKSTAKAVLSNYHALRQRRYIGDLGACDTLIDFERAVQKADLTARQEQAISLVYDVGLTQTQAAKIMGISQPNVKAYMNDAIAKIDDVYEYWAWLDGELRADDFIEEETEEIA